MSLKIEEISLVLTFIDERIDLNPATLKNARVTLQWHELFIVTFYYASCRNLL